MAGGALFVVYGGFQDLLNPHSLRLSHFSGIYCTKSVKSPNFLGPSASLSGDSILLVKSLKTMLLSWQIGMPCAPNIESSGNPNKLLTNLCS